MYYKLIGNYIDINNNSRIYSTLIRGNIMRFTPIGIYGRYASAKGASSSYLLQNDACNTNVIIDFGSGALIELQKHLALEKITAIILTHLHYDHISDILPFTYFLERNGISLPLFMSYDNNNLISCNRLIKHQNPTKISINDIQIDSVQVIHGKINSQMIKIKGDNKTLLYTSDFSDINEYIANIGDVDIVFGDACMFERAGNNSPHVTIKELAENTPVNVKLYLCHLTDGEENKTLEEALKYHSDTQLAVIGETIIF